MTGNEVENWWGGEETRNLAVLESLLDKKGKIIAEKRQQKKTLCLRTKKGRMNSGRPTLKLGRGRG